MNEPKQFEVGDLLFEAFQDAAQKWRWHCTAMNGEKVCTSGESFASKGNAERAMGDFITTFANGFGVIVSCEGGKP